MKHIVSSFLYLLILFCLSKFVFEPTYLYYELWWLDIPMHILGGVGVVSLANAIFVYKGTKVSYWKLLVSFLVIAFIWEMYEYINDIVSYRDWSGWVDTLKDTIDGIVGMSITYLFIRK